MKNVTLETTPPTPILPAASMAIVRAMALGDVAWQDSSELAEVLGWSRDAVEDELATLDAAGWLEVWNRPDAPDPFVTFSPLGATRLGLRLIEVGPTELPRWAYPSEPDPPLLKARGVSSDPNGAALNSVIDEGPGPAELAERADMRFAKSDETTAVNINALPLPILLRGQSLTWHGPHQVERDGGKCPGCRSNPMGPREYCLCCDRWGFDRLMPKADPSHRSAKDRMPDRRQQACAFRELMKSRRKTHRQSLRRG